MKFNELGGIKDTGYHDGEPLNQDKEAIPERRPLTFH